MIDFILANRADPEEMLPYAAFHNGYSLFTEIPVSIITKVKLYEPDFEILKGLVNLQRHF